MLKLIHLQTKFTLLLIETGCKRKTNFFLTLLLLLLLLFICGHPADIVFLLFFPFSSCDVSHLSFSLSLSPSLFLSFSHRCAGTTAVVCIVRGGHLWCATLGDSVAMLGRADDPLVSKI